MLAVAFALVMIAASLVFVVLGNTYRINDKSVRVPQLIFGSIALVLLIIASRIIDESCDKYVDQPSALDVYNGKTTLAITYVDSVPVDTTIVFKK